MQPASKGCVVTVVVVEVLVVLVVVVVLVDVEVTVLYRLLAQKRKLSKETVRPVPVK